MPNPELAALFLEIADLLDLDGEKFKPEAYRRAARTLEATSDPVEELVRTHRLSTLPGVGDALAKKIEEYVETGHVHYLERLRAEHPPGLLELLRLDGVGPKTVRRLHLELGVDGPDSLRRAIEAGRLDGMKGFGPRKIELLRASVSRGGPRGRTPLAEAQAVADHLIDALRSSGAPIDRLSYAGSLRRRRETVGDIDLVATSESPRKVMEAFTHLPAVGEVKLSGATKTTVVLGSGLQVDLRVVPAEAYGATLQYLTGSKDHNVRLRTLALEKGLSLNEYGVTRGETLVSTPTEEEVYSAVGLAYVPPELRENQGEVEAAREGRLPDLLPDEGVPGEFHIHIEPTATDADLEAWLRGMTLRRLPAAGFVLEGASTDPATLRAFRTRLQHLGGRMRVGLAIEVDGKAGLPPASLPLVDYVILRAGGPAGAAREVLQGSGSPPLVLSHFEGTPDPARWLKEGDWPRNGATLELGVAATDVRPDTATVRAWAEQGGSVVLSSLPQAPGDLARLSLSAGVARRAWVPRSRLVAPVGDSRVPHPVRAIPPQ